MPLFPAVYHGPSLWFLHLYKTPQSLEITASNIPERVNCPRQFWMLQWRIERRQKPLESLILLLFLPKLLALFWQIPDTPVDMWISPKFSLVWNYLNFELIRTDSLSSSVCLQPNSVLVCFVPKFSSQFVIGPKTKKNWHQPKNKLQKKFKCSDKILDRFNLINIS